MKTYTIHELAGDGDSPGIEDRADRLVFVKEGISILALLSPIIWCIWYRMWLPLLLYIGVAMAIVALAMMADIGDTQIGFLSTLLNFGVALEANNIRRWMLGRNGARMIGVVSGRNLEECEYRFFTSWLKTAKEEPSTLTARLAAQMA